MMIASLAISLVPIPKGRPRVTMRNGRAQAYTPAKTRSFEHEVAYAARAQFGDVEPYTGAVEVEAHFALPIPKSWPKRDQNLADAGLILPSGRADLDNYIKAATDALNGIVYADDGQIVRLIASKRYSRDPGVTVTVRAA